MYLSMKVTDSICEVAFLLLSVGGRIPKCPCGYQIYFIKTSYFWLAINSESIDPYSTKTNHLQKMHLILEFSEIY